MSEPRGWERELVDAVGLLDAAEAAEARMRKVAEELRADADENEMLGPIQMRALADRLSPLPKNV